MDGQLTRSVDLRWLAVAKHSDERCRMLTFTNSRCSDEQDTTFSFQDCIFPIVFLRVLIAIDVWTVLAVRAGVSGSLPLICRF